MSPLLGTSRTGNLWKIMKPNLQTKTQQESGLYQERLGKTYSVPPTSKTQRVEKESLGYTSQCRGQAPGGSWPRGRSTHKPTQSTGARRHHTCALPCPENYCIPATSLALQTEVKLRLQCYPLQDGFSEDEGRGKREVEGCLKRGGGTLITPSQAGQREDPAGWLPDYP